MEPRADPRVGQAAVTKVMSSSANRPVSQLRSWDRRIALLGTLIGAAALIAAPFSWLTLISTASCLILALVLPGPVYYRHLKSEKERRQIEGGN